MGLCPYFDLSTGLRRTKNKNGAWEYGFVVREVSVCSPNVVNTVR